MPKGFSPEDICRYQPVSHLHCVAKSGLATCEVKSASPDDDTTTSALWAMPLDGGTPFQFTHGGHDRSGRWSPDGSQLAFLSSRDGTTQIYLIPASGGEARQLSRLASGASSAEWSPDGKHLLAVCSLPVDSGKRGAPDRFIEPGNEPKDAPKVCWRLPYKLDGVGFLLDNEMHLFSVDAATGDHEQLTSGPFEVRSVAWSADSRRIAYTRTREGRLANRTDVWVMDADGGNARRVTEDVAAVMSPQWSPDGKYIVFCGSADEGDSQMRLWLCEPGTGDVRAFGDESIEVNGALAWSPGGDYVYFNRIHRGRGVIARMALADESVEHIVSGERQFSEFALLPDRLVYIAESLETPNEVFACALDGSGERRLADFNPWWYERVRPRVEMREFDVPDGRGDTERIEGWLLEPPDANGATPLLIDVHGGPGSYVLLDFPSRPYWLLLVSKGWRVLSLNTVGSSSYGREFSERLRRHWGEYDLDQHVAAVHILQEEGLVDERVAIAGKSYGGYMAAWAITQCSTFRASVIVAPITDIESHFGTSDSGYYADHYSMEGGRHSQPDAYRQLSPLTHAHKSRTPALILQGEDDQRCPVGQAEQLFVCLMRKSDTPVEMVLYLGADHHLYEESKPLHRMDVHRRLVEWVTKWVEVPRGSN